MGLEQSYPMKTKPRKTSFIGARVTPDLDRYLRERADNERRPLGNLVAVLLEQARDADKNQQPAA